MIFDPKLFGQKVYGESNNYLGELAGAFNDETTFYIIVRGVDGKFTSHYASRVRVLDVE